MLYFWHFNTNNHFGFSTSEPLSPGSLLINLTADRISFTWTPNQHLATMRLFLQKVSNWLAPVKPLPKATTEITPIKRHQGKEPGQEKPGSLHFYSPDFIRSYFDTPTSKSIPKKES